MRLSVSIGLAITTAAYSSSVSSPQAKKDITFAYDRAYICSIIFAVIGLLFVPFMRLGRQGSSNPKPEKEKFELTAPEQAHQHDFRPSRELYRDNENHAAEEQKNNDGADADAASTWSKSSNDTSILTVGTCGSDRSYFSRWSWESGRSLSRRYSIMDSELRSEICIKCRRERVVRVVLAPHHGSSHTYAAAEHKRISTNSEECWSHIRSHRNSQPYWDGFRAV